MDAVGRRCSLSTPQDKTAQFVSRNGTDFEKRILANEKDNVKFQFLQPTSPFHAYYQFKIAESKAADAAPAGDAGAAVTPTPTAPAVPPKAAVAAAAIKAAGPPAAEMYTVRPNPYRATSAPRSILARDGVQISSDTCVEAVMFPHAPPSPCAGVHVPLGLLPL